jgi:hypothetical protein
VHFETKKGGLRLQLLALLLFVSIAQPFRLEVQNFRPVVDSYDAWSGMPAYPAKHSPIQRVGHANDEADRLKSGQNSSSPVILTAHLNVSPHRRVRGFAFFNEPPSSQAHFCRVLLGRAPPVASL